jgi:WD40 repeat protein
MSACRHCLQPLSRRPARACAACREQLHVDCWEQLAARGSRACGHEAYTADLTFLDAGTILSADGTGVARRWDVATGVDAALKGPGEAVRRVHAGGEVYALVGDSKVALRPASGEGEGRVIEGFSSFFTASALAASGSRLVLAIGSQLRGVEARPDGKKAPEPVGKSLPDGVARLALSPDGLRLAALLNDGRLVLRDAELGLDLALVVDPTGTGESRAGSSFPLMDFSPDGSQILLHDSSSIFLLDGLTGRLERHERLQQYCAAIRQGEGGRLRLATSQSQKVLIHTVDPDASSPPAPREYAGLLLHVTSAAFWDEHRLAIGGADGFVMVIDLSVDGPAQVLRGHRNEHWILPGAAARRLWSLPSAQWPRLAVGDGGVWLPSPQEGPLLRSIDTGRVRARLPECEPGVTFAQPLNLSAGPGPEPDLIAVTVNEETSLRSLDGGPPRLRIRGEKAGDRGPFLRFPRPGEAPLLVAADTWPAVLEAFEGDSGEPAWSIERPESAPLSGETTVVDLDGHLHWFCKPATGRGAVEVQRYRIDASGRAEAQPMLSCTINGSPDRVAPTPDGAHLLVSQLYTSDDRRSQLGLFSLETGAFLGPFAAGHFTFVRGFVVSPAGHLVATCADDNTARLWNLTTGRQIACFAGFLVSPGEVTFSQDGGTLLVASGTDPLEALDLGGLDPRADMYSALVRGWREGSPHRERAASLLGRAAARRDPEALAALLAFRTAHPAATTLAAPDRDWLAAAPHLAQDFDRRVRRGLRDLAGGHEPDRQLTPRG